MYIEQSRCYLSGDIKSLTIDMSTDEEVSLERFTSQVFVVEFGAIKVFHQDQEASSKLSFRDALPLLNIALSCEKSHPVNRWLQFFDPQVVYEASRYHWMQVGILGVLHVSEKARALALRNRNLFWIAACSLLLNNASNHDITYTFEMDDESLFLFSTGLYKWRDFHILNELCIGRYSEMDYEAVHDVICSPKAFALLWQFGSTKPSNLRKILRTIEGVDPINLHEAYRKSFDFRSFAQHLAHTKSISELNRILDAIRQKLNKENTMLNFSSKVEMVEYLTRALSQL